MRIALIQLESPDAESAEHRLDRVRATLENLEPGIDLIVLPELWKVGYNNFDRYTEASENLDGPTTWTLAKIAQQRGCHIHTGTFVEQTEATKLRNTGVLIAPTGQIVHGYSKIHVFGYRSREAELLLPGTSVRTERTDLGTVAATTCDDLRFPGLWTEIVDGGAELVIVPAAWPMRRLDHWQLLTAARAVDNQVIVVACNAAGTHGGTELAGHSRIVDPWGRVVAEASAGESITIADVDIDIVAAARSEFPVLADRLDDYRQLSPRKVGS